MLDRRRTGTLLKSFFALFIVVFCIACQSVSKDQEIIEWLDLMIDYGPQYACGPKEACVCWKVSTHLDDLGSRFDLTRICPTQKQSDTTFEAFLADGTIVDFCQLRNARFHGDCRGYHPDGSLAFVGTWEQGCAHGRHEAYHENGQVFYNEDYVNGVAVGTWNRWSEEGDFIRSIEWEDGLVVKAVVRNEEGELIERPSASTSTKPFTTCMPPLFRLKRSNHGEDTLLL